MRVQPGASRDRVVGKIGDSWKIAITAPPIEGRANRVCAALLAKLLGRPKRDVELAGGAKSRTKTFEIAGATGRQIEARLLESSQ